MQSNQASQPQAPYQSPWDQPQQYHPNQYDPSREQYENAYTSSQPNNNSPYGQQHSQHANAYQPPAGPPPTYGYAVGEQSGYQVSDPALNHQFNQMSLQPPPVPPARKTSGGGVLIANAYQPPPTPPQSYDHQYPGNTQQAHYIPPPPPQRHPDRASISGFDQKGAYIPPPPPKRQQNLSGQYIETPDVLPPQRNRAPTYSGEFLEMSQVHYAASETSMVAYVIPFPKPRIPGIDPSVIPTRFFIYEPLPPPLYKPDDGSKEGKIHLAQRKWQEEVRSANTTNRDASIKSWKGAKAKVTRGVDWAMTQTTTSGVDFAGRIGSHRGDSPSSGTSTPTAGPNGSPSGPQQVPTKKKARLEEMVLVYPPSCQMTSDQMKTEFINTMLRTKSKAQRDTIIATGLMPVAYGIDILATFVWPFGGLGEIDTVWAAQSFKGAKQARSVSKQLSESDPNKQLQLNFGANPRMEVLKKYLDAQCHIADAKLFPDFRISPGETDVLDAIEWHPLKVDGKMRNKDDVEWERLQAKNDVKAIMHKAGKEWVKWCKLYEKDPEKALKK